MYQGGSKENVPKKSVISIMFPPCGLEFSSDFPRTTGIFHRCLGRNFVQRLGCVMKLSDRIVFCNSVYTVHCHLSETKIENVVWNLYSLENLRRQSAWDNNCIVDLFNLWVLAALHASVLRKSVFLGTLTHQSGALRALAFPLQLCCSYNNK